MNLFFDDSPKITQESRLRTFLNLMPLAIGATLLSVVVIYFLFSPLVRLNLGPWIAVSSLLSGLWLVVILWDRGRVSHGQHPMLIHGILAALLVVSVGTGLVFLFVHLAGGQKLFIAIFFITFLLTGTFITAMLPSIMLTWSATMGVLAIIALVTGENSFLVGSILGAVFLVIYQIVISLAYYRLYHARFIVQLEAETRERELATYLEQSPLSIVLTDLDGNIIRTNRMTETLTGYSKTELSGQNPRILKSEKTPESTHVELWNMISQGKSWTGEFVNKTRSGQEFTEHAWVSPIKDGFGVIRRYMAIKLDITLQKQNEAQLKRQNAIIGLLLRDFENNSSDWLWELDQDLRFTYVSEKLIPMLHGRRLVGLHAREFMSELLPPEDVEAQEMLADVFDSMARLEGFADRETKILLGNSLNWLAFSATPIVNEAGSHAGWRGVGRNITSKKLLELRLSHRVNFDELTGLPTRYRFQEVVQGELDSMPDDDSFILGIMQLSKLDGLRSELGSQTCNDVIKAFIHQLQKNLGQDCLLARLERDEFALWVRDPDVWFVEGLHQFCRRVNEHLAVNSDFFQVGLAVGLAFYPDDAQDRSGLFHAADLALNEARTSSTRKVIRYQLYLATASARKLKLTNDLSLALENLQLFMVYQPQVDTFTGCTVGAEALMRWNHPDEGMVSPAEFIPIAEQSGLITAMGEWSIFQACKDAMQWLGSLSISVNVSGVQLRDPRRLIRTVKNALAESGLQPNRLTLEITESALFGDEDGIVGSIFAEIRAMGIKIALDDFGTGYSSLSIIQRLHLDKLKVDQSFVRRLGRDLEAEKMISIIVEMAQSMGLATVAEGIEHEAQAEFLRKVNCDWIQGYFYGKPMSQSAFCENVLSNQVGTGQAPTI